MLETSNRLSSKYWLNIVDKIAEASTCRVKIGCILLDKSNEMVGVGFLGSVPGDNHCLGNAVTQGCLLVDNYGIKGTEPGKGSCIRTIHAEMNAVIRCNVHGIPNSWLTSYSTYAPCLDCFKVLLAKGVRTFYFTKDYRDDNRQIYMQNLHPIIIRDLTWVRQV